jgi:hypothetical protein
MSITDVRNLCRTAEHHYGTGNFSEALPLAKEAVRISKTCLGTAHYGYAMALCTLGWIVSAVHANGMPTQDPAQVFAEVEARGRELLADDFNHGVVALLQTATFWEEAGDRSKASRLYEELLTAHTMTLGDSSGDEHPRYYQIKAKLDHLMQS